MWFVSDQCLCQRKKGQGTENDDVAANTLCNKKYKQQKQNIFFSANKIISEKEGLSITGHFIVHLRCMPGNITRLFNKLNAIKIIPPENWFRYTTRSVKIHVTQILVKESNIRKKREKGGVSNKAKRYRHNVYKNIKSIYKRTHLSPKNNFVKKKKLDFKHYIKE